MPLRRILRILRETYGFADATHNRRDTWRFPTPQTTSLKIRKNLDRSLTYGEIDPKSLYRALASLKLRRDDNFVDLGSGSGKVVLQAALQSNCKKVVGVEVVGDRHEDAMRAHANLMLTMPEVARRITLIKDNFLNVDLSKTTVIYMANKVFQEPLPTDVLIMLKNLPNLRAVVCMVELCHRHNSTCHKLRRDCAYFHEHFKRDITGRCDVSWSKGSALLMYTLRH